MFIFALVAACLAFSNALDNSQLTAGNPFKFEVDRTIIYNATETTESGWVSYKQCDSRWAGQELGYCSGTTICSAGCAMTSVAMMLKTKGASVGPSSLDSYLTHNGGYANGCDIVWAAADHYGVTKFQAIETANESEICSGLSKGHGIIANVHNGGHWVLLTGCKGSGVFTVNDPGYSTTTYSMKDILREAVYH
jgi:Pyruvate/2-oxoacid:ferredoxin oxidoreductase delta subunit